ncbi:MAG: hypothetical protein Q4A66_07900 [Eubacteriales bacterium]|nr:hypothetical protein [Eubacteriales bacterium]
MQRIILREHGVLPGEDCTHKLFALTERYKEDTVFVFEEADYVFESRLEADYRLSNTDVAPVRKLGVWLKDAKNVRMEGNGARLWFSGQMQPFTLDHCEDCTIESFVIDWKKPLVAEGVVTGCGENYVDLYVDPAAFPHRLTADGWLEFDTGNGEWYALSHGSQIQFDANTRTVRCDTGDKFSPAQPVEQVGEHVYRMRHKREDGLVDTVPGNINVLRHNDRLHAGIFAEKCKNTLLSDITVHSCGGLGCLAQFCETLTCRRVHFVPNERVGRRITSGRDDGMHITCCSGLITIEQCAFLGLMDDPINVHSCCVTADEILDSRTIRCRYMHPQACGFHYWAEQGDEISFIERSHMQTFAAARAASYELETMETFLLRFEADLPASVLGMAPGTLALDNLSHTAAFDCTNNRFGSCRARGILVSTPKPVRIRRNLFESSGSAVLVAGDSNYWFESGECHDVEIADNIFTNTCLSSMYQFTEGMISICPVVPEPETDKPFHKNIRITGNVFDTPEIPVLYGFATSGLTFSGNRIFRANGGKKWHPGKNLIKLEHCSDVTLGGNSYVGRFELGLLETKACENVRTED